MAAMAVVGTIISRQDDSLSVIVGIQPYSGGIVQEWTLRTFSRPRADRARDA
ncbi:hypothetical protein [Terrabacter carboxydivorans]|uniref:hypothetical protein n=1 Tax=Terrabacter carboxydivorans TaxID=619730 RepID=UPI0031D3D733